MTLKTFDKHTLPAVRTKGEDRPMLTVSAKSGVIRFNQSSVRKFRLKPGSTVSFHQDEARSRDWYIAINPANGGFPFQQKAQKTSMSFGHRDLARLILSSLAVTGTTEIPIGPKDEVSGLYPLLTSAATASVTSIRLSRSKARKKVEQHAPAVTVPIEWKE